MIIWNVRDLSILCPSSRRCVHALAVETMLKFGLTRRKGHARIVMRLFRIPISNLMTHQQTQMMGRIRNWRNWNGTHQSVYRSHWFHVWEPPRIFNVMIQFSSWIFIHHYNKLITEWISKIAGTVKREADLFLLTNPPVICNSVINKWI